MGGNRVLLEAAVEVNKQIEGSESGRTRPRAWQRASLKLSPAHEWGAASRLTFRAVSEMKKKMGDDKVRMARMSVEVVPLVGRTRIKRSAESSRRCYWPSKSSLARLGYFRSPNTRNRFQCIVRGDSYAAVPCQGSP